MSREGRSTCPPQEESVPNTQEIKQAAQTIDYEDLAKNLDESAEEFLQDHEPTQATLDFTISI